MNPVRFIKEKISNMTEDAKREWLFGFVLMAVAILGLAMIVGFVLTFMPGAF